MEGSATGHACAQIPEEIWREIFRLCASSRTGPATFNPMEVPILLTHVCAQWRLIAHDEESLWTSLRAHFPYPMTDEWHHQHLLDWLRRAKQGKVSLHLEQTYSHWEAPVSMPRRLLDGYETPPPRLMPQVAGSVKNLTNLVLLEISQEELQSLPSYSFQALERLVIPTKYWDHSRIGAFASSPALRRVALEPQIADPSFMPIFWEQLTHFLEFWDTEKRTWECIKRMENIRYLAMMFPRKTLSWSWPDERLVVASLESLSVNLWDYHESNGFQAEGAEFLDHFRFPQLKSLRLVLRNELTLIGVLNWAMIEEFLDRFRRYTLLEYFSLSCANTTRIDRLFEVIPTVQTLDIHLRNQNPRDLGALFEALTIVNEGPFQQHPLPQLRKFVIDLSTRNMCRSHPFDVAELASREMITLTLRSFLTSRLTEAQATGDEFTIVIYGTDASLIESYVTTLDDLVKAGLNVEVNILPSDVKHHECNCSRWWMYRDLELKDWKEVLEMARAPSF